MMTLIVLVAMSIPTFAANGSFLTSPSQNGAPEIVGTESECSGNLVITAYKDRDTLPENDKAYFEDSYYSIASASNLVDLNSNLKTIADSKKVNTNDLVVSDVFYAHVDGCEGDVAAYTLVTETTATGKLIDVYHGVFDITLDTDTLKNYMALMNYVNGEWVIVENAKVTADGYLQFSTDTFGPFAIVVGSSPAQTGDIVTIAGVSGFAIAAIAMIVVLFKTKKRV